MSFFKNLTLERIFILLSLLGSMGLVYTGLKTSGELEALRRRQVDVGDEGTGVGGVGEQACGHQRGAQSACGGRRELGAHELAQVDHQI